MIPNHRLAYLEAQWQKDPNSRVFLRFADELRRDSQFVRAVQVCRQGLVAFPGYLPALVCLGRSLESLDLAAEAAETYREVLDLAPDNPHALRGLVRLHCEKGDFRRARALLETLSLTESNDDAIADWIEAVDAGRNPFESPKTASGSAVDVDFAAKSIEPGEDPTETAEAWLGELSAASLSSAPEEGDDYFDADFSAKGDDHGDEVSVPGSGLDTAPAADEGLDSAEDSVVDEVAGQIEPPQSSVQPAAAANLDDIDREFAKALSESAAHLPVALPDPPLEPPVNRELQWLSTGIANGGIVHAAGEPAMDTEVWLTMGLKHEKQEHYEAALKIYQLLARRKPNDYRVLQHLERVRQLLLQEPRVDKKGRVLSIWLDKVKGAYHVS